MPEQPPASLIATLEYLGLATAGQVAQMGRRVRRLARDLPQFESVWVDALSQARILTPFQAAEINAGRGPSLRIGPYVIGQRLPQPCYVACYRARNIDSHEMVRLAVIETSGPPADAILRQLESLVGCVERTARVDRTACGERTACVERTGDMLPSPFGRGAGGEGIGVANREESPAPRAGRPHPSPLPKGEGTIVNPFPKGEGTERRPTPLAPRPSSPAPHPSLPGSITHAGADAERLFAAAPWVAGRTAAEWMVHHGRFPPQVVLEIARAMLAGLVELEKAGLCHGDVSTSSLILSDDGNVVLSLPGLRGILRPEEGYAHADLLPEGYDTLAPERVSAGTPPAVPSEIYACGCVWWHLLCGRPPLAGGDSLAKLRAAQAGETCDVRRYAPDVPAGLAAAISACVEREPSRRPESMARLTAMLGPPTRGGKEALADCLARAGRPTVPWTTTLHSIRKSNHTPLWIAGAVCFFAAAVAILGPLWRQHATSGGSWNGSSAATAAAAVQPSPQQSGPGKRFPAPVTQRELRPADNTQPQAKTTAVVQAGYQQSESKPPDLILPTQTTTLLTTPLEMRPGQCVRGPTGKRAAVLVPAAGLRVDKENIRFENVDFIWRRGAGGDYVRMGDAALVQLLASRAEFSGCSFQGEDGRLTAIRWMHPGRARDADTALPCGRLRLADCFFSHVPTGIHCCTVGALAIELKNTLRLGGLVLLRFDHCPLADEPLSITLEQVTLRDGGPLLWFDLPRGVEQAGEISIVSTACAFVTPQSPLVWATAASLPSPLFAAVHWTGQGSLVSPKVPIVVWRKSEGQQVVDESSLSIAGLVRSEVQFAGPPSADPAASRLTRWQAPLQSADPPGIDPAPLPKARW